MYLQQKINQIQIKVRDQKRLERDLHGELLYELL